MNIKYTKELLQEHAKNATSFGGMIRLLGLKQAGGNFRNIQIKCRYYEIDTSHFTGQGWNKGLVAADHPAIEQYGSKLRMSFEERFSENSRAKTSDKPFRKLAIENGIAYECAECKNDGTWREKPLSLDLDHKNGVSNDNRLENLRFLCPNCHRQTETWGKKKKIDKFRQED